MYFVLTDLGYDGIAVNVYKTKKEALKQYTQDVGQIDTGENGYYDGVALIKGKVIQSEKLDLKP
jgi:hypothetical protein